LENDQFAHFKKNWDQIEQNNEYHNQIE